jgi:hypothetical protein
VRVDRAGNRLISAARLVLVDHRGPLRVVAHSRHQVLESGLALGCELVTRVAQVMGVRPGIPMDSTACGQADILLKLPRRSGPPCCPGKTSARGSSLT